MMRKRTHRAAALAGLSVVAAVPGVVMLRGGPEPARADAPIVPLRIRSVAPQWVAPGARVPVTGVTGAGDHLVLRANGRIVARTTADARGRFDVAFTARRLGRFRLTVRAGSTPTAAVGAVVVRPLVLAAVGDITFGEQVGPAVAQYGGRYPWTGVAATLRAADITTGNLETSVSTRGLAADKEFTFRGPPQAVMPLRSFAGFDVLTLANNHAVDYGRTALLDTLRYVHAAGIKTIGAGATDVRAHAPALVRAGGLTVAFLGYSDVNPLGFVAGPQTPGTAAADAAVIGSDVRAALRRADLAVCFFHWGSELQPEPDARQRTFAAACLDAGASVVLGAHPHVLGRVERARPHRLVAWTLGNFVFPSAGATADSAILRVALDRNGVRGFRLLPVRIDGFRPRLEQ
jgi:poly-gamma-glutamate capsule biosynthesis protein CapA/YwtB (metallophosphatase superfamily)